MVGIWCLLGVTEVKLQVKSKRWPTMHPPKKSEIVGYMVGHLLRLLRQHLGTWWVHGYVYLDNIWVHGGCMVFT